MKLKTEDEKRMWREAYCAALTGLLMSGSVACDATGDSAASMADSAVGHWQFTAKADDG